MAINHALTIRQYLRMLAWMFLLYVLWCFAPTLYAAAKFRVEVFQAVQEGASSGLTPDQVRKDLLFKADALNLPLAPQDLEVSTEDSGRRIYAHYSYGDTVTCFKQKVNLDFTGTSSAEIAIGFRSGSLAGN